MNRLQTTIAVIVICCTALLSIIFANLHKRQLPKVEYHMELINDDHVKLYDENFKLIKTIELDSIGYYIIEDNI